MATANYNRYAYCLNNPILFTDPIGMKTKAGQFFNWIGTGAKNAWDWTQDGLDNFSAWANKIELPPIVFGAGMNTTTWEPYYSVNVAGNEVYNSSRNYSDPTGYAMESFNEGMENYYANTQSIVVFIDSNSYICCIINLFLLYEDKKI